MAASGASGKDKIGVLFVHTAARPLFGADTRGTAQLMQVSEPSAFEVHAACATGPEDRPRPTSDVLREIPDLRRVPVDLGSELPLESSALGKPRALLGTVSVLAGMVRLGPYVRRNGIELIRASDPTMPWFTGRRNDVPRVMAAADVPRAHGAIGGRGVRDLDVAQVAGRGGPIGAGHAGALSR